MRAWLRFQSESGIPLPFVAERASWQAPGSTTSTIRSSQKRPLLPPSRRYAMNTE